MKSYINMAKLSTLFLFCGHRRHVHAPFVPYSDIYVVNLKIIERVRNHVNNKPCPLRDFNHTTKKLDIFEYIYLATEYTRKEKTCRLVTMSRYPENMKTALTSLFSRFCDTL